VTLAPDYDCAAGDWQEGLLPGARDRENFSYGEDFSRAEHEFFTSGKKSSRSWGTPRETGRLDWLAWLMGRATD
jgi:hypothetical protein